MNEYGSGKKTDMEQTVLESITTGWKKEDLEIPKKDREILKELAYKVKDISSNIINPAVPTISTITGSENSISELLGILRINITFITCS